jgi:hypothetical protein
MMKGKMVEKYMKQRGHLERIKNVVVKKQLLPCNLAGKNIGGHGGKNTAVAILKKKELEKIRVKEHV